MEHIQSTEVLLPSMSIASEMSDVKIQIDSMPVDRITINGMPEMVVDMQHTQSNSNFYIGDEALVSSSESLPQLEETDKTAQANGEKSAGSIIMNLLSGAKDMVVTRYSQPFKSKSSGYKAPESGCMIHSPRDVRMLFNVDGSGSCDRKARRLISPFVSEMLFSTLGMILSSLGNFAAGLILDHQKGFEVYENIPELIYLVPTLLGLKGNLEMTMVARLCTMANMGQFSSVRFVSKVMVNNLAMVNCQAILVSFLASAVTFLIAFAEQIMDAPAHLADSTQAGQAIDFAPKMFIVLTTSLWTANLACFISTVFLILLIAVVSRLGADPDNFATALAASIGDMITSYLLGVIGQCILANTVTYPTTFVDSTTGVVHQASYSYNLIICSMVFFVMFFFATGYVALGDAASRRVLTGVSAWVPIIASMLLSFASGTILRSGMSLYRYIALFQPLLNGVGGNLAAIATSRLSTLLHKSEGSNGRKVRQDRPPFVVMIKQTCKSFTDIKYQENIASLFFVFLSMFVHSWFGYMLPMSSQETNAEENITLLFYAFYIVAASIQVIVLLFMVRFVVSIIWWMHKDPDTSAIPILTATGDVLGSVLLLVVFALLSKLADTSAAPVAKDALKDNPNNLVHTTLLFVGSNATATIFVPTTLPTSGFSFADFQSD